jgi:hypothetical protein
MTTAQPATISPVTQTKITRAQRKTIRTQLAMRNDELALCRTDAQRAAVQSEVARLQGLLASGRWA